MKQGIEDLLSPALRPAGALPLPQATALTPHTRRSHDPSPALQRPTPLPFPLFFRRGNKTAAALSALLSPFALPFFARADASRPSRPKRAPEPQGARRPPRPPHPSSRAEERDARDGRAPIAARTSQASSARGQKPRALPSSAGAMTVSVANVVGDKETNSHQHTIHTNTRILARSTPPTGGTRSMRRGRRRRRRTTTITGARRTVRAGRAVVLSVGSGPSVGSFKEAARGQV